MPDLNSTTALPVDLQKGYLRGIADSAKHAIDFTKHGQPEEAGEHVDAIGRLVTAYRGVTGQDKEIGEQIAAAIRAQSSRVDDADLAAAVLPIVRAAADAAHRRGMTDAADLVEHWHGQAPDVYAPADSVALIRNVAEGGHPATTSYPGCTHACDNCDGIDPGSCLMNSERTL
ncbi:hypothetical protein HY68_36620 [Streptomyces sp. AcH 505]|uniref:hypothetical protein n=1 Tax=Streptomyces sp. AcH 505 TaxID=352211 RepID=UPI0005921722|nr:hypothetical protein HY68_36620 [Streptomyces sp. AcH 505]